MKCGVGGSVDFSHQRKGKKRKSQSSLSSPSLFKSTGSPGMAFLSLAHSPRSINLQRSEQKGRKVLLGVQVPCLPQVGQLILSILSVIALISVR